MLRAEPGSLQESAVENHLRICDKIMQSKDSVTKIIDGKGAGQFLRLVGLMHQLNVAASDVEDLKGSDPVNGTDSLVEFFVAVVEKAQKEQFKAPVADDDDGEDQESTVTFGTGTLMESRLPSSCIEFISTETVNQAREAAEYYRTCMHTAVTGHKIQSSFGAPRGSSMPSSLVTGEPLPRIDELLKELCMKPFKRALISSVSSIKLRASSKGRNPGPSELPLLCDLQESGLFDVSVHYPQMGSSNQVLVIHKKMLQDASSPTKILAVRVLTRLYVTLDEFVAQSESSDFDVEFASLPPLVTGTLPYGLKPFKSGPIAPVATQDRALMEICDRDKNDSVEEPDNKKNRVGGGDA
jgi:hypothetical protein